MKTKSKTKIKNTCHPDRPKPVSSPRRGGDADRRLPGHRPCQQTRARMAGTNNSCSFYVMGSVLFLFYYVSLI